MNNIIFVSIIIPVFNGSNYIRDAIDSCIEQNYTHIEIIVINDGSTDNTEQICKEYGNKIRYFKKINGGVSSALNLGIEKSKGEYISWLSHDDYYLPNKISDEINVVKKFNKNSIIFSNYHIVNKDKKRIESINFKHKFPNLLLHPQYLIIYTCVLNGCALLIPKLVFDRYGKFDEKLKYTQDYKKWGEIIDWDFQYNNSYVLCSRRHGNQDTELHASTNFENDDLWYWLICLLYKNETYDKFLGYQNSLCYFNDIFSHNKAMIKTNGYIKENIKIDEIKKNRKEIRKELPEFRSFYGILIKAANYYKIFGLKKLFIKILNIFFK